MGLRISNCNNFFKIKGNLDKNNLNIFKNEFDTIFEHLNSITISIEDVDSMDSTGVDAIIILHKQALAKNKNLSIIGFGCKDLYNYFKS